MDEDGFEFGTSKKKSAKSGRRARKEEADVDQSIDALADELADTPTSKPVRDPDAPPRPSRRMGGWGEEKRKTMEELDDERLRPQESEEEKQESDEEPDIPTIPDLEEETEVDSTVQIAMAPSVRVNRVATYRELDHDLLRHAQFLTLDNEVDLKLLAKGLSAETDVQEEDVPWDWDRLFTEVTSELLTEWESNAEKEEEPVAA